MIVRMALITGFLSLPLRECGLKLGLLYLIRCLFSSLPLRERGLKFEKEDDRRFSNYGTSMEKLFGYEQVAKRIANIRLTIENPNEEKVEFS